MTIEILESGLHENSSTSNHSVRRVFYNISSNFKAEAGELLNVMECRRVYFFSVQETVPVQVSNIRTESSVVQFHLKYYLNFIKHRALY